MKSCCLFLCIHSTLYDSMSCPIKRKQYKWLCGDNTLNTDDVCPRITLPGVTNFLERNIRSTFKEALSRSRFPVIWLRTKNMICSPGISLQLCCCDSSFIAPLPKSSTSSLCQWGKPIDTFVHVLLGWGHVSSVVFTVPPHRTIYNTWLQDSVECLVVRRRDSNMRRLSHQICSQNSLHAILLLS